MTRLAAAEPDVSIKVVLLGDSEVGKSSIALRFVSNTFRPYTESTIGASFLAKTIELDEEHDFNPEIKGASRLTKKRTVSFQIWDTAGQEKYHSLTPMYYRGAVAAILVFDMCNYGTFETLQNWVAELRGSGPSGIILVVCANKSDLANHRRVKIKEAKEYAEKIGAFYTETSARDNTNVKEIFQEIAKQTPASVKDTDSIHGAEDGFIHLDLRESISRRKYCC